MYFDQPRYLRAFHSWRYTTSLRSIEHPGARNSKRQEKPQMANPKQVPSYCYRRSNSQNMLDWRFHLGKRWVRKPAQQCSRPIHQTFPEHRNTKTSQIGPLGYCHPWHCTSIWRYRSRWHWRMETREESRIGQPNSIEELRAQYIHRRDSSPLCRHVGLRFRLDKLPKRSASIARSMKRKLISHACCKFNPARK